MTKRQAVVGAEVTGAGVPDSVDTGLGPRREVAQLSERRWTRDARRRRLLAYGDLIAILVATAAVSIATDVAGWPLVFAPLWLLAAKLSGLYDRDHRSLRHLTADEVPTLIVWAGVVTALLALLLSLTPGGGLGGGGAALHLATLIVAAIGLRALVRSLWWKWTPPETVGLIGDAESLASFRRKLGLFRDMHFEPTAELDTGNAGDGELEEPGLQRIVDGVERIILAASVVDTELIAKLTKTCREQQVKLSVVSPLRGRALPSTHAEQLADLPIVEYNTWDPSRSSLLIKRVFDVVVAGAGLLLFLPLLPLLAVAIKLDSHGPILFSQIRAGLGGRPFRIYKLRTMQADAEGRLEDLISLERLDQPAFKLRDDPRVTRVGRRLRRFSIDELPQLGNVLVGEMSIVGPRPEQVELVARYSEDERRRLGAKPGITGPMQIFGRGELTFTERLAVELDYVENVSLSRDLRILLHTVPAVFRGTGAY